MYRRRSKSPYYRCTEGFRFHDEASSFKIVPRLLQILLLLITTSCSSLFEKKERLEYSSFSDGWNRICLSGEGKGRLKYGSSRYSFSYEMLLKSSKKKWLIGMTFPLHGEEILSIGFDKIEKNQKVDVTGGFINRLYSDLKIKRGGNRNIKLLESLFYDMGKFLEAYNSNIFKNKDYEVIGKGKARGIVKYKHEKLFNWSVRSGGLFRVTMKEKDKRLVNFNFYNSENFSNRVDIKLKNQGQSDTEKGVIELNLAIIHCNSGH